MYYSNNCYLIKIQSTFLLYFKMVIVEKIYVFFFILFQYCSTLLDSWSTILVGLRCNVSAWNRHRRMAAQRRQWHQQCFSECVETNAGSALVSTQSASSGALRVLQFQFLRHRRLGIRRWISETTSDIFIGLKCVRHNL